MNREYLRMSWFWLGALKNKPSVIASGVEDPEQGNTPDANVVIAAIHWFESVKQKDVLYQYGVNTLF